MPSAREVLVVALSESTRTTYLGVVSVEAVVYHDGVKWLRLSGLVRWLEYLIASLLRAPVGTPWTRSTV